MTREDEEMLLALSRIGKDSGSFALGVLENRISRDDQIAFGCQLVDLAEAIHERASRTAGIVIEGSVSDDEIVNSMTLRSDSCSWKDGRMTVGRPTADDPLFRMADQVPLGRHLGLVAATDERPSEPDVRPFGLRFATSAVAPIPVELSGLRYDRRRQITVDDVGAPVFGKHSTGQTSTRTSDGHKSMDSDTDHTED